MMTIDNALHIFIIPLSTPKADLKQLLSELSEEEQNIAMRFKFEKHRRRYIVSHAAMRHILAAQLKTPEHDLKIEINENKKPYIQNNPLYFNLSHSKEMALLALSYQGIVGIDVEFMNPVIDMMGIAERYFHPVEYDQLKRMPEENRDQYFYHCWTGKEAFLKAKGVGIANYLKMFALDIQDLKKLKIISTNKELEEFGKWSVHSFQPGDHYRATVVSALPQVLDVHEYIDI